MNSKELENKIEACLAKGIRAELAGMMEIPRDVCEAVWSALTNAHIFVDNSDKEPKLRDELAEALCRFEDAMEDSDAVEP